jgi:SAM-dependent methyltransferase
VEALRCEALCACASGRGHRCCAGKVAGAGHPSATTFDEAYFTGQYPDYFRQNPLRKVEWYVRFAEPWSPAGPTAHLDIGCGLGALAGYTASTGRYTTHATDISEHAVDVVRKRFPAVDAQVGSAEQVIWPDKLFGLISIMDVLEHLENPAASLRAAKRQLAPGGAVLIAVPVYDGLSGPMIRRLDKDPSHLHKWGRQRWLSLISQHFEIRQWAGVFRLLPPAGPYLHIPTAVLRRHSPAIVVAAN